MNAEVQEKLDGILLEYVPSVTDRSALVSLIEKKRPGTAEFAEAFIGFTLQHNVGGGRLFLELENLFETVDKERTGMIVVTNGGGSIEVDSGVALPAGCLTPYRRWKTLEEFLFVEPSVGADQGWNSIEELVQKIDQKGDSLGNASVIRDMIKKYAHDSRYLLEEKDGKYRAFKTNRWYETKKLPVPEGTPVGSRYKRAGK